MMISNFRNHWRIGLTVVALALLGQSCSISLGTGRGLDGGVWRSDDHGRTWQQKNFVRQDKKQRLTLNDVSGRVLAFDSRDPDHLYLGTRENGIWSTTNAGEQWNPTSLRSGDYQCLDFDPLNSSILYTAAGPLVLKSVDGGAKWNGVYTESQPGQAVTCVAVDPFNGHLVWATTSGGKVLLSEDYGQTWTMKYTHSTPFLPRRLYLDPSDSGVITIFTRGNGIIIGANRGSAWEDRSTGLKSFSGGLDIRSVVIVPSGWYLATAYGLLQSADQGISWNPIKTLVTAGSIPLQNVAVNPRNGRDLFITTDQKIHHTTDGGETWSVKTLPTSRLPVLLTFDPVKPDRLYVATFKLQK